MSGRLTKRPSSPVSKPVTRSDTKRRRAEEQAEAEAAAASATAPSARGARRGSLELESGEPFFKAFERRASCTPDVLSTIPESTKDDASPSLCPITDANVNPFRLMDLPAEIRNEIYRACLTRPFNILLSKQEQSAELTSKSLNADEEELTFRVPQTQDTPGRIHPVVHMTPPQNSDPLLVNILRANKQIYNEARSVLYNENIFSLDLETALPTLAALHQRSRRQIKHVELTIPCYNEILEKFQETVRLSLRYCWGLRTFVIHMPFDLPGTDVSGPSGNTGVYANGFDILRWLPKQCEVVLKGNVCEEIEAVVSKNANLAKTLDELAYARRQLISNEHSERATA